MYIIKYSRNFNEMSTPRTDKTIAGQNQTNSKNILQKNKKTTPISSCPQTMRPMCLSGEYVYPSEINISQLPQLRNTIAISLYKFIEIYINDLSHTKNAKFDHCAGNIGPICKQNKIKIAIEFKCNFPTFFIIVSRSTYCEAIQVPI